MTLTELNNQIVKRLKLRTKAKQIRLEISQINVMEDNPISLLKSITGKDYNDYR